MGEGRSKAQGRRLRGFGLRDGCMARREAENAGLPDQLLAQMTTLNMWRLSTRRKEMSRKDQAEGCVR